MNTMRIDPHVHCKTWAFPAYGKKSAMQSLVEEAEEAGIHRVFDMPNIINPVTGNPVIRKADVNARLNFARQQGVLQNYRTYIGATSDADQLSKAAEVAREDPFVPGIKAYMVEEDYGRLSIEESKQEIVYATLKDCGYEGVLALHCEDNSKFKRELWNKERPYPKTHCFARPLESESSSIEKAIDYARKADFKGIILTCHTTSQKCIELLKNAKKDYGLKTAAEISPHHALFNMDDMGPLGTAGKMNPPLRTKTVQEELLEYAKHETKIPLVIGSDNAQHPFMEKIRGPYPSGMGMEVYRTLYPALLKEIRSDESVSARRVDDLTYHNIVDLFGKKKCS